MDEHKGNKHENMMGVTGLLMQAEAKARKFDTELADKIRAMQAEIMERVDVMKTSPRVSFEPDGAITATHQGTMIIAAALARTAELGQNYVSLEVATPDLGVIVCEVRRKGRLTPHSARIAAEALARDLAAKLAALGHPVEMPVTFLPDVVPFEGEKNKDPTPWLRFEHKHDPPRFSCVCGGVQHLPSKMTVEGYEGMAAAFKAEHDDCKDMLSIFEIGPDKVIAYTEDDAWIVWCDHMGEKHEDYKNEPCIKVDPARVLRVIVDENGAISDSGQTLELTAMEWARREGRGFLCSDEY